MNITAKSSKLFSPELQSWAWMLAFLAFVSPGILSYAPYTLMWDESFYAHRIVCMNREFYSFSVPGIANCLAGTHKAPAIQLVGLLWGPAVASEAGVGLALVGLALFNFVLVLLTYRVCLRAGVSAWRLAVAGACIGLTPLVRENAGAIMVDSLVAWLSALTVMLIALEFRTRDDGDLASFWRGGLWAFAIMAGSLTKMTFAVVGAAAAPILFYVRWRRCRRRAIWWTILGSLVLAVPGLLVWVLCGPTIVSIGLRSAFGEIAALWSIPGMNAGSYLWRYFSELGWALLPLAVLLVLFLRGIWAEKVRALPVAIVLGFLLVAAMGENHERRYTLIVAVAMPLALSWTSLSTGAQPPRFKSEHFLGGLLAGLLLAIPMVARPRLAPIRHAGELMQELSLGRPAVFVIATDGPESNIETFQLARQIGGTALQPVYVDTLVYDAINKRSLEEGYRRMAAADYVLFLRDEQPPGPAWSRRWAGEYRTYAEHHGALLAAQTSHEFVVFRMKTLGPVPSQ